MSTTPVTVTTLVSHAHIEMALECLGSLLRCCCDDVSLRIMEDGTVDDRGAERLSQQLAGAKVIRRTEADTMMADLLRNRPATQRFRDSSPLALKLLDAIELSSDPILNYCDTDILFFRAFQGLASQAAHCNAIFAWDTMNCYTITPRDMMREPRLRLPEHVNTGFFSVKRACHDPDMIEWFLAHRGLHQSHWTEQTCWALLAQRTGCYHWDSSQVRVIREGYALENGLIAGHFTKPNRHLLTKYKDFASGLVNESPVALRSVPTGTCKYRVIDIVRNRWSISKERR